MDRVTPLPVKKVIKVLEKIGFEQIRHKGSHMPSTTHLCSQFKPTHPINKEQLTGFPMKNIFSLLQPEE
jgi:predicted RNA binding protein YcfA (HicA-like mRNA interferase family)